MPRNDQITRQWLLLPKLDSGAQIVRPASFRNKIRKEARKIIAGE